MKYQTADLIKIYKEGKKGNICFQELNCIKPQLLLAINKMNEAIIPHLNNLIETLLLLYQENKLHYFDYDFILFAKKNIDYEYFSPILYGITYSNERINNNYLDNEILFLKLNAFFEGINTILEIDVSWIKYLEKVNPDVANIIAYYIPLRYEILNNNDNLDNKLVLLSILNHLATFLYINKNSYQNDFALLEKTINHIKNNILSYRMYFIDNNVYDSPSFIGSISSGGLKQELFIIGNILNDVYNQKIIVKKRQ